MGLVGSGNLAECKTLTDALLGLTYECLDAPCAAFGVYQPAIGSEDEFLAMSAYWYTVQGIGLCSWGKDWNGTPQQIHDAATSFCQKPWADVQSKYSVSESSPTSPAPLILTCP